MQMAARLPAAGRDHQVFDQARLTEQSEQLGSLQVDPALVGRLRPHVVSIIIPQSFGRYRRVRCDVFGPGGAATTQATTGLVHRYYSPSRPKAK